MRYFCKKLPYGFIVLAAGFSCLTFSSSSAYDFSSYTPTLDRLFRNGEASIDSGYTLSFEPADESDYSFISYEVATGNNVIPVYYKINYAYDGGSTGGKEISHTSSTQEDNTFTGYFHNLAQSGYGGGLYNGVGSKISRITADFIDNSTTVRCLLPQTPEQLIRLLPILSAILPLIRQTGKPSAAPLPTLSAQSNKSAAISSIIILIPNRGLPMPELSATPAVLSDQLTVCLLPITPPPIQVLPAAVPFTAQREKSAEKR